MEWKFESFLSDSRQILSAAVSNNIYFKKRRTIDITGIISYNASAGNISDNYTCVKHLGDGSRAEVCERAPRPDCRGGGARHSALQGRQ